MGSLTILFLSIHYLVMIQEGQSVAVDLRPIVQGLTRPRASLDIWPFSRLRISSQYQETWSNP